MTEMMLFDESAGSARLLALKSRHNLLVQATKEVLSDGLDFGKIPGTGDKPTLLKPGAEKLCFLFGLRPTFEVVESIEDWNGGLFYYRYRCTLHDQMGGVIADGEGSCNSREKKYRYRNAERVCPHCGKPAIIKGKTEYGGGWLCYRNKGGCGAKFADNAPEIVNQETGQIENPEPYDLVNTLQKMAQKRALVAAVLVGTGASQFFTQDVEDMQVIDLPVETSKPEPPKPTARTVKTALQSEPEPFDEARLTADIAHAAEVAERATQEAQTDPGDFDATPFASPTAATAWAIAQGAFGKPDGGTAKHARNAWYKATEGAQNDNERAQMWRAYVARRLAEQQAQA